MTTTTRPGALAVLCLLALVMSARADLIYVPTDQPDLAAAIAVAQDNDVIYVADGTWSGLGFRNLVTAGKAIAIRSASDDPSACIIDVAADFNFPGRGFTCTMQETATTEIRGFSIINGFMGTSAAADGLGAAVWCNNASPRFVNCRFSDCETNGHYSADAYGGAVALGNSDAEFIDCVFASSRADTEGGGLSIVGGAPTFTGCEFSTNESTFGGAIRIKGGTPRFTDCVIAANTANGSGAGVYAYQGAEPLFVDCRFEGNETWTPSGGGAGAFEGDWSVYPTFQGCWFVDNLAAYEGGAISASHVVVEGCVFSENEVVAGAGGYGGEGGAIKASYYLIVRDCTFDRNVGIHGGAIYWTGTDSLVVRRSIISNGGGGGAVVLSQPGDMDVTCSDIVGNVGGDWVDDLAVFAGTAGNLGDDPQYCGVPGSHILTLQADSPCAPGNNACGVLVGALGVECGLTAVMVSHLSLEAAAGRVSATWRTSEPTTAPRFTLAATCDGVAWNVPAVASGPSAFSAVDRTGRLAAGGEVRYRLWLDAGTSEARLLADRTVRVPTPQVTARLDEVSPNPFNPRVTVSFTIVRPQTIRLEVLDLQGRRVASLAQGPHDAGRHEATWDGRDARGVAAAAGVYIVRLATDERVDTRRIALVR